jgi:hypothetical protein
MHRSSAHTYEGWLLRFPSSSGRRMISLVVLLAAAELDINHGWRSLRTGLQHSAVPETWRSVSSFGCGILFGLSACWVPTVGTRASARRRSAPVGWYFAAGHVQSVSGGAERGFFRGVT